MVNRDDISFSVLVPVYNAEQFLSECIESALGQTYSNFEVILVDDGSTDASGAICDRYAQDHTNLVVYHTPNGGQIRARELAMAHAKGDFFVFLDADDRLYSNALETIAAAIEKYQCDCVIYGFTKLINGEKAPGAIEEQEEVLYGKRDIYRKCLKGVAYNAIWRKAAKASVYKNGTLNADCHNIKLGEDLLQSLAILKNSNGIAFIKDALYEYRDNPNSITYTYDYAMYVNSMRVNEMVYRFLQQENVFSPADFEEFRSTCLAKHVDELLRICNLKSKNAEKVQLMRRMRDTEYFRGFVNKGNTRPLPFKHRIVFMLNRWGLDYVLLLSNWLMEKAQQ